MEHLLKYSRPATSFTEALVLGNGSLGATVYGGVCRERISLNHDTFWSGFPNAYLREGAYEAFLEARECIEQGKIAEGQRIIEQRFNANYSQAYLPIGNLYIEPAHTEYTEYQRTLDLSDATMRVEYATKDGRARREYFVSYPAKAMIVRLTSDFSEDYTFSLDTQMKFSNVCVKGERLLLSGKAPWRVHARNHIPEGESEQILWDGEEETISFTSGIRVKTDGEIVCSNETLTVKGAKEVVLFLVIQTSFIDHRTPPTAPIYINTFLALQRLAEVEYASHKKAHTEDYTALYQRVTLDLQSPTDPRDTDERLRDKQDIGGLCELLFNFGRYLTIASSREGSQATNLQGIWNEDLVPPWQSNYTVNINTEMNYWPTLMVNLKECYGPLLSLIDKISDTGRAVAKHYYGANGFVSHHNVDLWGHTSPVGLKTDGSAVYAFWNLSSGWLSHHLFEYYLYTHDEEFLRQSAYPTMCESARFYLSLLKEDEDGHLILTPSTSPENTFQYQGKTQAIARYTTMSQSIVQNLFYDILTSAQILGIEDDFVKEIRQKAERLDPFRIGSQGQLLEWDREYEETDAHHRHISHLFGLYPGTLITTERTPELAQACRQSLQGRGKDGTGWSLSWKFNVGAKLKDGELAFYFLIKQLKLCENSAINMSSGGGTYPNLLDAHPPYQIDGNFGMVSGIAQLFMQCEDGKIKLLPALPRAFANGSVKGLCAHGNVSVDIEWRDGSLVRYTLHAREACELTVCYRNIQQTLFLKEGETYTEAI